MANSPRPQRGGKKTCCWSWINSRARLPLRVSTRMAICRPCRRHMAASSCRWTRTAMCSATSFPISSASSRTLPGWNCSASRLPMRSGKQRQSRTTTATLHWRAISGLKCFEFRSPTSTSSIRATASTRQKSTGRT